MRGKVLRPWLESEKKMWANGDPERASFTHENYTFVDRGLAPDGLAQVDVKSRRKDLLLARRLDLRQPGRRRSRARAGPVVEDAVILDAPGRRGAPV